MRLGARIALVTLGLGLGAAVPADAAQQQLGEGLTVPADNLVHRSGVMLEQGETYTVKVSGNIESTHADGSAVSTHDAFYCFDRVPASPPGPIQCRPSADAFKSVLLQKLAIDPFGPIPGFDRTKPPAYRDDHTYTFRFRAPINGKLSAQIPTGGFQPGTQWRRFLTIRIFGGVATGSGDSYRIRYGVRARTKPQKSRTSVASVTTLDLQGSGSVKFAKQPKLNKSNAGVASSKLTLMAIHGSGPKAIVTLIPLVATGPAVATVSGDTRRVTVTYEVAAGGNDTDCRAGDTMTILFIRSPDNQAAQLNGCLGRQVLSSRNDKSVKVAITGSQRVAN